jgi:hypothetical protein
MTRKTYDAYVREDLAAIDIRALTLYALSGAEVPWDLAPWLHDEFRERAARELWEEGALHFDPAQPYYEPA